MEMYPAVCSTVMARPSSTVSTMPMILPSQTALMSVPASEAKVIPVTVLHALREGLYTNSSKLTSWATVNSSSGNTKTGLVLVGTSGSPPAGVLSRLSTTPRVTVVTMARMAKMTTPIYKALRVARLLRAVVLLVD